MHWLACDLPRCLLYTVLPMLLFVFASYRFQCSEHKVLLALSSGADALGTLCLLTCICGLWSCRVKCRFRTATQQCKRHSWIKVLSGGKCYALYHLDLVHCHVSKWSSIVQTKNPHLHWAPIMMSHWELINSSQLIWREQGTFAINHFRSRRSTCLTISICS